MFGRKKSVVNFECIPSSDVLSERAKSSIERALMLLMNGYVRGTLAGGSLTMVWNDGASENWRTVRFQLSDSSSEPWMLVSQGTERSSSSKSTAPPASKAEPLPPTPTPFGEPS